MSFSVIVTFILDIFGTYCSQRSVVWFQITLMFTLYVPFVLFEEGDIDLYVIWGKWGRPPPLYLL